MGLVNDNIMNLGKGETFERLAHDPRIERILAMNEKILAMNEKILEQLSFPKFILHQESK
jgi:hypothetical protein